jgi:hypothetical protein
MPFTAIDPTKLYRTEVYADGIAGEIIRNIPITADGIQDPVRQESYAGSTQLRNNQGQPVPIQWGLKATTLKEALAEWLTGLNAAVEEMNSAVIRNRIASSIGQKPNGRIKV